MLISIDRPRNYTNALFTQRRSHTERPSNIISPETAMTENKRLVSVEYMELRPKTITFSDNLFQPLTLFDVSMDDSLLFFICIKGVARSSLSFFLFPLLIGLLFFLALRLFLPRRKRTSDCFWIYAIIEFQKEKKLLGVWINYLSCCPSGCYVQ